MGCCPPDQESLNRGHAGQQGPGEQTAPRVVPLLSPTRGPGAATPVPPPPSRAMSPKERRCRPRPVCGTGAARGAAGAPLTA